jgi:hypothetical protein
MRSCDAHDVTRQLHFLVAGVYVGYEVLMGIWGRDYARHSDVVGSLRFDE